MLLTWRYWSPLINGLLKRFCICCCVHVLYAVLSSCVTKYPQSVLTLHGVCLCVCVCAAVDLCEQTPLGLKELHVTNCPLFGVHPRMLHFSFPLLWSCCTNASTLSQLDWEMRGNYKSNLQKVERLGGFIIMMTVHLSYSFLLHFIICLALLFFPSSPLYSL